MSSISMRYENTMKLSDVNGTYTKHSDNIVKEKVKDNDIPTIFQADPKKKKRCINGRLLPVKVYYFLHEGGGSISPFVSLVAKRVGLSISLLGIINTITVGITLFAKPIVGALLDKFGYHKIVWGFCHVLTVCCIFSLIFIPPLSRKPVEEYSAIWNCNGKKSSVQICDIETPDVTIVSPEDNNIVTCQGQCHQCDAKRTECNLTLHLKFGYNPEVSPGCFKFPLRNSTCLKVNSISCLLHCYDPDDRLTSKNSEPAIDLHLSYQFWWLSSANIVSGIAKRLVEVIQTSVIYGILGGQHSLFGKQKVFGALGYGLSFIIGGILNQYMVTNDGDFQYNYSFYIFGAAMLMASFAIIWLEVQPQPRPPKIIHDVGVLFLKPQHCLFFISVFSMGTFVSFQSTYSFWYFTDFGITPLILGLAKGVQAIVGEIPCLFWSGKLIKKIGHSNVVSCLFITQTVVFCIYALMDSVLLVFVTEVLSGIVIGFFIPTATSYCSLVAPPGTATTLQGIFFATYKGAGRMIGNLVGGLLYSAFGGRPTYLILCTASFLCFLFNFVFNIIFRHRAGGKLNIA